ncbi:MAG: 23S rRNA (adenine(1618)-N(6))-methyltransferase RlmF, partial [Bacteroidota bacterium]
TTYLTPMHPRNRYQKPHDFPALAKIVPEIRQYFTQTLAGRDTLDFTQPGAVRQLNKALLLRDYGLQHWDIPADHLCPGVPGRLDYIHVIADLLGDGAQVPTALAERVPSQDKKQSTDKVTGLDIGAGASLIYPILGIQEYGWQFVGTDLDPGSLKVAGAIAKFNKVLTNSVILRRQTEATAIFKNIILPGEYFDFTMCNPPFFASAAEATSAASKKWAKLGKPASPNLNFGGRAHELWTPGGEPAFLRRMIEESALFRQQVGWFTTLVSKKGYLKPARRTLGRLKATEVRELPIGQGGKIRRVLAWRWE